VDTPDPVAAGGQIRYALQVRNMGPNPANALHLTQTLPAGVTYLGDDGGCSGVPSGTVSCDLGYLLARDTRMVTVDVLIDADLVYDAGAPVTLTSSAVISNGAGPDSYIANNTASEDTTVVAVADLEVLDVLASGPPELLIGQTASVTLTSVATNHGPSSPMDARLAGTVLASGGATVTPPVFGGELPTLANSEHRTSTQLLALSCAQPGTHTLMFNTSIAPTRPDDVDPDPSNNSRTASFTIECVVPVAINIKPHTSPNLINLRLNGVVPLAVLTTAAGEYHLPQAFDATRIQPLSVRFGAEDVVRSGLGGSGEAHGRGHPEASYELDERTRDADLDMVLHFALDQTGLQATDTKACVKGRFLAAAGGTFGFFGCDAILVMGP
jgi:uncharacterized repeat protein (TIGR01451 family)